MTWVSIIAVLLLIISFLGGMREGAPRGMVSVAALIIAISLTGFSYHWLAGILNFFPGDTWENFLGFLITLGIISLLLNLAFLFPRKGLEKAWNKGPAYRLLGGVLSAFHAAILMVIFTLVLQAFPVSGWLESSVSASGVLSWLVTHLEFVRALMPELAHGHGTPVQFLVGWRYHAV